MSNTACFALLTAAVVVVACGGTTAGPSPTPTATPAPTATATPTATTTLTLPVEGPLVGGATYVIDAPGSSVRMIVTVPTDGWQTFSGFVYKPRNDRPTAMLSHWHVADVYPDPCHWTQSHQLVGPTVDDLANALADQVGRDASEPIDVTVDGYRGKEVELSVPNDFDEDACDNGQFKTWFAGPTAGDYGGFVYGPGQRDAVYIVDVEGERVLIDTLYLPGTPEADLAELRAIFELVRLEP